MIKVPSPQKAELIATVLEAVEAMNKWRPVYQAVLKQTGCRKQAAAAVKWCARMEKEMEDEKCSA